MLIPAEIHDLPVPERVRALCNLFYTHGERFSVRTILQHVPDVKSTSTIHKHYREWKQELESQQSSVMERLGGFSEEFSTMFMREVTRFSTEAENRYKGQTEDALDQCRQAIDDLARADDRLYKQSMVVEQLETEIKSLRSSAAESAKAANATLDEIRKQLEEVKLENRQLAETNEKLRTEVAKGQLNVEHGDKFVQEVRAQLIQLNEDYRNQSIQLVETSRQLAQRDSENTGLKALLEQIRSQEQRAISSLEAEQASHRLCQADLRQLRHEIETLIREKNGISDKLAGAERQLEVSNRTNAEQSAVIAIFKKSEPDQGQLG